MSELHTQHQAHLARIARLGGVPSRRTPASAAPAAVTPSSPPQPPRRNWLYVASPGFDGAAVPIRHIMAAVCARYGLTVAELKGPCRVMAMAHPRQIAMYLAQHLSGASLPQIAAELGARDHTTVGHGVRKIKGRRSVDVQFDAEIAQLEALIRAGESPARFAS